MSGEDDTYSTIFTALKHPLRRRILRRLQTAPATYTQLLNELGIEDGLLNYHLENLHELIHKREDGSYILSEFGKAGLSLIKRIEDPVPTQTDKHHRSRTLLVQALSVLLIVVLSINTWSMYQSEQGLRSELSDKQSQIQTLLTRSQPYASLLDSNITTPIPKFEAVAKALSRGGWNSSSLRDMEVDASLIYVKMFSANNGGSQGFELLGRVTNPVENYSPKVEYNVTEPGAYPPEVGTMTYRYVWAVLIQKSSGLGTIPPPGEYYVDASTGELFVSTMVGVYAVPDASALEVKVETEGFGYPYRLSFTDESTKKVYEAKMTVGSSSSVNGTFVFDNIPAGQYVPYIYYHELGLPLTSGNGGVTSGAAMINVTDEDRSITISVDPGYPNHVPGP